MSTIAESTLIVIGAGPAGMMAAGQAAGQGIRTLLLEKMDHPGQKLDITGQGRCNLTNTAPLEEFIHHFGKQGMFLRQAFARFFNQELVEFMQSIGVNTQVERGGRIFPLSNDATQVTRALVTWAQRQGVDLRTQTRVRSIMTREGQVSGVLLEGDLELPANAVILASGGASFRQTGSSGDGFRMAADLGHTLEPIRPALVPIKTKGGLAKALQGLSLRNVAVSVYTDNKKMAADFGEMLFTHFGVSGPVILSMSGSIVDALRAKQKVEISIDLKPALDEARLDARLLRDFDAHGKQHFGTWLKDLLPAKLGPVIAELCAIPLDKVCHQVTAEERKRLRLLLKDMRLEVSGHLALEAAMVTAGGVSLKEVHPLTMESRRLRSLYFAGEVLDLAADTGGYNLQAAFSTGWVAGNAAATALRGSPRPEG